VGDRFFPPFGIAFLAEGPTLVGPHPPHQKIGFWALQGRRVATFTRQTGKRSAGIKRSKLGFPKQRVPCSDFGLTIVFALPTNRRKPWLRGKHDDLATLVAGAHRSE
jgi:hypothetical protein